MDQVGAGKDHGNSDNIVDVGVFDLSFYSQQQVAQNLALFQAVFPDFDVSYSQPSYLAQHAVVTPYNETINIVNDYILDQIPGEERVYYCSD
ncbi:DNA helicase PIF1, ATP-dependent [Corchorus capsularis]|uniref:DNA helicase PIF1, ATP-dependent n=1 Tax=Corchorus capsularis TaxID=210143 RepID=A0A1R3G951_COCAP|nr:DNA helicase PIF1, ATP-dependent [Corchorus capsularis]